MQVRVARRPWYNGAELSVFKQENGAVFRAVVNWEEIDTRIQSEPTTLMDNNEAQVLMDDLWAAGYRPTDGAGTAGSMMATQKHLEDMRTIAFDKLKIINRDAK